MKLRNTIFYVENIDTAKEFYQSLGFKIAEDFGKFISFSTDNEEIYFSIMEPDTKDKKPGEQACTFWSKDIDKFYEKMKKRGVGIVTELFRSDYGKTFAIKDLDGNKIEFVKNSESNL